MRILSLISYSLGVAILVFLIGFSLGSPITKSDEVEVTTEVPQEDIVQHDEVDVATTVQTVYVEPEEQVVQDEPESTASPVTDRSRKDVDDDDEDDESDEDEDVVTTAAPAPPKSPVVETRYNQSNVQSEFYIASQVLGQGFAVQPTQNATVPAPAPVANNATAVEESEDSDDEDEGDDDDEEEEAEGDDDDEEEEAISDIVQSNPIAPEDVVEPVVVVEEVKPVAVVEPVVVVKANPEEEQDVKENEIVQQDVPDTAVVQEQVDETVTQVPETETNVVFDGQARAGCECGKLPFSIPLNTDSGINEYPWTVAIVQGGLIAGGRPHCAGTLINDRYVVTSARCMEGLRANTIQVWLTAHDSFEFNGVSFGTIKANVQHILTHPNYNRRTKDNDIALVKLTSPIDISGSSYFVPACLPATPAAKYTGDVAKTVGWSQGRVNKFCQDQVPVMDNRVCNRDTHHSGRITENMMCAGYLTPNRIGSCIGDSGGPLVVPNNGHHTLIGIVSWSFETSKQYHQYAPTVYTRVAGYGSWILHNTLDADWCGL